MRGRNAIVQARGCIRQGWQGSEQQQRQGKARLHGGWCPFARNRRRPARELTFRAWSRRRGWVCAPGSSTFRDSISLEALPKPPGTAEKTGGNRGVGRACEKRFNQSKDCVIGEVYTHAGNLAPGACERRRTAKGSTISLFCFLPSLP